MSAYHARRALAALLATAAVIDPAYGQSANRPIYRTLDPNGVDLVQGDFVLSILEGSIGSGKGELSLIRSRAGSNASLWDLFDLQETTVGGTLTVWVEMGNRFEKFSNSGSGFVSAQANGSTLTTTTSGNYLFRSADGTTIEFSPRIPGCSPSGSSCTWLPQTFAAPDGKTVGLTWETWELCSSPSSCVVDSKRLANVSNSFGYSIAFTYAVDGDGGPQPAPSNWFSRTGAAFFNSTAGTSPLASVSYAYPSSTVTEVTDTASRVWRIGGSGSVTSVRKPGFTSDTTTITYGSNGLVSSVTQDGITTGYNRTVSGSTGTMTVTNALSDQSVIVSDLNIGRPTSIQDPLNRTTSFQYDGYGRLTQKTEPEGNKIELTYDTRGNVTQTKFVPKSGSGLSEIVTSASFDTSCSYAAKCNQPNSTTDALGSTTQFTYDSTHGGVLTETKPAPSTGAVQPQTRYAYTLANGEYQLTGISACQTLATCEDDLDEAKTVIGYDANGNVTSLTRTDGDGAVTSTSEMTYDALGNLTALNGPLGGADITRYRYDAARQVTGIMDPDPDGANSGRNIRAVQISYRADGQVSKRELGTITGSTTPSWSTFAASETLDIGYWTDGRPITWLLSSGGNYKAYMHRNYDGLGRPACTAIRMSPGTWGSLPGPCIVATPIGTYGPDRISQVYYDAAGQVTQIKQGVGTSSPNEEWAERVLTYTNNGQVQTLTDGEGNKSTYVYDGFDRLSQLQYPNQTKGNGTSNTGDYEQLGYDDNSNVTSFRTRSGTSISFGYDDLNRRISLSSSGTSNRTYTYDLLDRLKTATFVTGGEGVTNGYDALDRLTSTATDLGGTSRSLSYVYDADGNRTRLTWWDNFYVDYDRRVTGEIDKVRVNGSSSPLVTFAYDDLRRRTSLTRGATAATTSYTYDLISRLSSIEHEFANSADDVTISISDYNPASQIVSQGRSNNAFSYTGYANGNVSYTSNGRNEYTAVGSASPTYDNNRNLTYDGTRTYTYDVENKLTSSTGGSLGSANLYYDPLNRLDSYSPSSASRFIYNGVEVVARLDGSGNLVSRQIRGDAPDEMLAEYTGSTLRYFHLDERNSVMAQSDSTGAVASRNVFDEYGRPGSGNSGFFQYTGQMWMPEAQLYHYKNRAYSPVLGRFLQTDPIGYEDSPNLYQYVLNDPVNLLDPLGLCIGGGGENPSPANGWAIVCPRIGGGTGGGGGGGGGGSILSRYFQLRMPGDAGEGGADADGSECSQGNGSILSRIAADAGRVGNVADAIGLSAAALGIATAPTGAGGAVFGGTAIIAGLVGRTAAAVQTGAYFLDGNYRAAGSSAVGLVGGELVGRVAGGGASRFMARNRMFGDLSAGQQRRANLFGETAGAAGSRITSRVVCR